MFGFAGWLTSFGSCGPAYIWLPLRFFSISESSFSRAKVARSVAAASGIFARAYAFARLKCTLDCLDCRLHGNLQFVKCRGIRRRLPERHAPVDNVPRPTARTKSEPFEQNGMASAALCSFNAHLTRAGRTESSLWGDTEISARICAAASSNSESASNAVPYA